MSTLGSGIRAGWLILLVAVVYIGSSSAQAQEQHAPAGGALPDYAKQLKLSDDRTPADRLLLSDNGLPNVMLTGYWPPTNEMLRPFSDNLEQNPDGWVGENWEQLGYNVYAYFPEFPDGLGKGEGDFEVDYQDTSNDFWPLVEQLQPIAIISFGRAGYDRDWELEGGNRTYYPSTWSNDYLAPYDPTPELPIYDEPAYTQRMSTLPIDEIIAAVDASEADVDPYSTTLDTSMFLCNYMGYHANWYHELHADPADPAWCMTAGFIHLGYQMDLADAIIATDVTVRTVLNYMNRNRVVPGDLDCNGLVDFDDIDPFVLALSGETGYTEMFPDCNWLNADCNGDEHVDFDDINAFVAVLSS